MLVWLRLKHCLYLLENLKLELEQVVVVHFEKPLDALGCNSSHLLILVRQLCYDQGENVQAIVEMWVALQQFAETLNTSQAQLRVETL